MEDNKELANEMIKRAESGKHSDFEFIKNYEMLIVARTMRKASRLINKTFHEEAKKQLNAYMDQMKKGFDDVQKLVNHRQYEKIAEYYQTEYNIFDNMIYEFCCFCQWHPFIFLGMWAFGDQRDEGLLYDHSGNGFTENDR